jgi:hypothetical protein
MTNAYGPFIQALKGMNTREQMTAFIATFAMILAHAASSEDELQTGIDHIHHELALEAQGLFKAKVKTEERFNRMFGPGNEPWQ